MTSTGQLDWAARNFAKVRSKVADEEDCRPGRRNRMANMEKTEVTGGQLRPPLHSGAVSTTLIIGLAIAVVLLGAWRS